SLNNTEDPLLRGLPLAFQTGSLQKAICIVEMALWVKDSPSSKVTRGGAIIIHVSTRRLFPMKKRPENTSSQVTDDQKLVFQNNSNKMYIWRCEFHF
ncbi:mCG145578, partial [Mus musculus]